MALSEKTPNKSNNSSYSDYYKSKYGVKKPENVSQNTPNIPKAEEPKKAPEKWIKKDEGVVLRDVEKAINSREAKKIERGIIAGVYIIVILAAIYFTLAAFFPDASPFSPDTYVISAEDSGLFDALSSFYIEDSSILGEKSELNGTIVRSIISSKKFNFVLEPKENIKIGKNAVFYLTLALNNSGNIYVNEELIFPSLENYQLIGETDSDYIYASKEIMPYIDLDNFKDNDADISEYLVYDNLPGASVWSTRELDAVEIQLDDYNQESTLIDTTFRGDLKLAVYVKDNLNISFAKQDLNMYLGEDAYNLEITNSEGKVIQNRTFWDDGDNLNSNKPGKEQNYSIYLEKLDGGVYYINFNDISENTDGSIKNIHINSNKVLIIGNFMPIKPFEFYTKSYFSKEVGFYYWHKGKDQIIKISGTADKKINLSTEWFSKKYNTNLTKGEYSIDLEKGDLWVYNDFSSISKESWFDVPFSQQVKFDNPKVILIDKASYDKTTGFFSYAKEVSIDAIPLKISLRSLNPNSVSFSKAKLVLD